MARSLTSRRNSLAEAEFLTGEKPAGRYTRHTPSANIEDRKEEYLITLAVPGLRREDFEITVVGNALCIQPKKPHKTVSEQHINKTRCEYNFSSWKRKFVLPDDVDASFAHAFYLNGELDVHIPKNAHPLKSVRARIDVY